MPSNSYAVQTYIFDNLCVPLCVTSQSWPSHHSSGESVQDFLSAYTPLWHAYGHACSSGSGSGTVPSPAGACHFGLHLTAIALTPSPINADTEVTV